MSSRDEFGNSLTAANYTSLSEELKVEASKTLQTLLRSLLEKHPELAAEPQKVELLIYCYQNYVNFDPQYRDLSIPEKLQHAAKMAASFWEKMFTH